MDIAGVAALIVSLITAGVAVYKMIRQERRTDQDAAASLTRAKTETEREDDETTIQQQNRFISTLQKAVAKHGQQIDDLFKREIECQRKVSGQENEISHLQRQNVELKAENVELRARVRDLEAVLGTFRGTDTHPKLSPDGRPPTPRAE